MAIGARTYQETDGETVGKDFVEMWNTGCTPTMSTLSNEIRQHLLRMADRERRETGRKDKTVEKNLGVRQGSQGIFLLSQAFKHTVGSVRENPHHRVKVVVPKETATGVLNQSEARQSFSSSTLVKDFPHIHRISVHSHNIEPG